MPVAPRVSYPGVYIQEVPSEVRTIVGVETATTAFVGRAKRGPVNQPVVVNSFGDFERIFGGLWTESYLGFSVRDFYLNGGVKAVVVRLFNNPVTPQVTAAAARAKADEFTVGVAQETADAVAQAAEAKAQESGATVDDVIAAATATSQEGEHLASQTRKDAANAVIQAAKDAKPIDLHAEFGPDSARLAAEIVRAAAVRAAKTDNPTLDDVRQAAQQAATQLIQEQPPVKTDQDKEPVKLAATAVANAIDSNNFQDPAIIDLEPMIAAANEGVTYPGLEAKYPGSWGNKLRLRIENVDPKIALVLADRYGVSPEELFNLRVYDGQTGREEEFQNVTLQRGSRRLDRVLAGGSELVRVRTRGNLSRPLAHPSAQTAGEWEDNSPPANDVVPTTGSVGDGDMLTSGNFTEGAADKQGIYALDGADIFNLMCIPPYKNATDYDVDPSVLQAAEAYCRKRRAMLLVDPPAKWLSKDAAKAGLPIPTLSPSANAAIYFPRVKAPNPLRDNRVEEFAPSGALAGIYARTDGTRGVWKAPAGLEATISGVVGMSVSLTDRENGELNPLGINCLRTIPAAGHVVWGARTMRGDDRLADQWKYVPVRRTALYIEESLYRGTQWAVFEPNDEPLWAQLRLNIGSFMHGLFRQGAFQGSSPKEAYQVQCDSSTTTQADIDKGIVNIIVGFAPLKPAEFVVIYIQQIAGQLET